MQFVLYCLALVTTVSCTATLQYEYIVVGGGTSGLAVANRLSENPDISIAIIEAGVSQLDNERVKNPWTLFDGGTPDLQWNYTSIPQHTVGGREMMCTAAKALGGTSTINGMTYLRAEKEQLNDWADLGTGGWDWDSVFPYYKKVENLTITPTGEDYIHDYHGFDGYLKTGWPALVTRGEATTIINQTTANIGLPYNPDANGGRMHGFVISPLTVDGFTGIRSDAARSYYLPVMNRPNIHLFTNSTARRLTWNEALGVEKSCHTASGVEFADATGETVTFTAKKEVIVSLGAMRTPLFLEHSGIGHPKILNTFDIPTRIDLRGVGHNLNDQPNNGLAYNYTGPPELFAGFPAWVFYPTAYDVWGGDTQSIAKAIRANVSEYASKMVVYSGGMTTHAQQEALLHKQIDTMFNNDKLVPLGEIILYPNLQFPNGEQGVTTLWLWPSMPFGKGSIHSNSSDPMAYPAIDYNFLEFQADMLVQSGLLNFARKLFTQEPFASLHSDEVSPGFNVVPENGTVDQWSGWILQTAYTNSHEVGTASMRNRELGGVIDSRMKVYGTSNVRVVDASIWPTQLSGHLTPTCYMVAEKASDMIKEDALILGDLSCPSS